MFPLTLGEIATRVIKELNRGFAGVFNLGSIICICIFVKEFASAFVGGGESDFDPSFLRKVLIVMLGCDLVRMSFVVVTSLI